MAIECMINLISISILYRLYRPMDIFGFQISTVVGALPLDGDPAVPRLPVPTLPPNHRCQTFLMFFLLKLKKTCF